MLSSLPLLPSLSVLTASLIVLSACGTTPPSRFYMLEAMPANGAIQAPSDRKDATHIGIGPVQLAPYLDRTQIVTRTEGTEISLSDTHRWAEPLHNNFARVLAQNLSVLMATDKVSLYPSQNWSEIDYQVLVNVWQLDANERGSVTLVANWSVRGRGSSGLLTMKKSVFSTDAESAAYNDIVRAVSKTVESLGREIAETIRVSAPVSRGQDSI